MLKEGLLTLGGTNYTVFELQTRSFFRFDICREGTKFHVDPDNVLYSCYGKRKLFQFGDADLDNRYHQMIGAVHSAALTTSSNDKWINGEFHQEFTKGGDNFYSIVKHIQARWDSEVIQNGEDKVLWWISDANLSVDLAPQNAKAYEAMNKEAKLTDDVKVAGSYWPLAVLAERYDLSWERDEGIDYRVPTTLAEAVECLKLIANVNNDLPCGFDTETTTLDFNVENDQALLTGIVLSATEGQSFYFPFLSDAFPVLPIEFLYEQIVPVLEKKTCLVAHHKKYDRTVMIKYKIDHIPIKFCTLNLDILKSKSKFERHDLKTIGARIRPGRKYLELSEIFVSKNEIDFRTLPKDIVRIYACPDADTCRRAFEIGYPELPTYSRAIYGLENELSDLKAEQEYYGFRVDRESFLKEQANTLYCMDMLERLCRAVAHREIMLNSAPQLQNYLYSVLKCEVFARSKKTGAPSTGIKALKKLSTLRNDGDKKHNLQDLRDKDGFMILSADALNKAKYPFVLLLIKYREYQKLNSAFFKRFVSALDTGRIYFWINQLGAETGRQSSPMHQLPKKIKKLILPDTPNHYLVDADYSQIELRLWFSMAGEQELIDACNIPDNDIHRVVGAINTGKELWEIDSDLRQDNKRVNFGVIYGIGAHSGAEQQYGAAPTTEQVQNYAHRQRTFFRSFRKGKSMMDLYGRRVLEKGYVTTYCGRNRHFPEAFSPDLTKEKRGHIVRAGQNTPVQGTAADIMKMAEVNMRRYAHAKGWDKLVDGFPMVRCMISAHDEVVVSVHKSIPEIEIVEMMKSCMEDQIRFEGFCEFHSSVSFVDNWYEGKEDAYAMPTLLRSELLSGKRKIEDGATPKERMLKTINKYRDDTVREYMEGLIAEHGVTGLDDYIRHPSLTHMLVARFPSPRDLKLDHLGAIKYAADKYLEWREGNIEQEIIAKKEVVTPTDIDLAVQQVYEYAEVIHTFDKDGNIVVDEYEDVQDDEDYDTSTEWIPDELDFEVTPYLRVWSLFDSIVIEVDGLTPPGIKDLVAYLQPFHKPNAYCTVLLQYGQKMYDAGIKAERIPEEQTHAFIEARIKRRVS